MNIKRFTYLINLLSQVPEENFNIETWINFPIFDGRKTNQLFQCGYTACIGGHLTLSKSWTQVGGLSEKKSHNAYY